MKNVICFFGSFNPVHFGHLKMAKFLLGTSLFDEVLIVLSNNPAKVNNPDMASFDHRLNMLNLGIKSMGLEGKVLVSVIEKDRYPSYTYDTLKKLEETYPDKKFNLAIGSDLIKKVNIWRNSKKLLSEFKIYVMDRYESGIDKTKFNHLVFLNTPVFECSSTDVRNNILKGVSVDNMIPIEIEDYIKNNKIY